ncbi:MAG: patatin-like phospholipase family protein [bacterium]|nr:patatin-like phospholipase family protein [bacterium]
MNVTEHDSRVEGRPELALCLSGGGFRASIFHLGVLRRLHETGVLAQIKTISSVSGGSILAGHLAERMVHLGLDSLSSITDWDRQIGNPFLKLVSRDLRTWPILWTLPFNWLLPTPRAAHMVERYRDRLSGLRLKDIPPHPRFMFCATNLAFGVNWYFEKTRVGDYQAGYAPTPSDLSLAFAVAASACFPPLFGPMGVPIEPAEFKGGKYQKPDRDKVMRGLRLSDGGVYDNLGLEPALKNHDTVIVSDCGSPFGFKVSRIPFIRYARYITVVQKQVSSLRKTQLFSLINDQARASATEADDDSSNRRILLRRGVYLGLTSDVEGYKAEPRDTWNGYSDALVKSMIGNIRTDLDGFTIGEQAVLENHGYALADVGLRKHLAGLGNDGAPFVPPRSGWLDEKKVSRALRHSSLRFWPPRWFGLT